MNTGLDVHIPEDLLETYAMGQLPAPHCAPLEEHLLICPNCQIRLEKTDEFVCAVRAAVLPPDAATLASQEQGKLHPSDSILDLNLEYSAT